MSRRGLVLATVWLGLAGCDRKVAYSYFNVTVTLDRTTIDDELLDLVSACGATATLDDGRAETRDLRCVRHNVGADLGVFQYTTSRTSGSVKFTVVLTSYWGARLATGESESVGIAPSSTTSVMMIVHALANAPRMPPSAGGPDDAAAAPGPDVGVMPEAGDAPAVDAGVDAGIDSSPDLAVDASLDAPPLPVDLAPDAPPDGGEPNDALGGAAG